MKIYVLQSCWEQLVVSASSVYAQGGAPASSSATASPLRKRIKSGASAIRTFRFTSAHAGRRSASLAVSAINAALSQPFYGARKISPCYHFTAKTTEATIPKASCVQRAQLIRHVTECKPQQGRQRIALGIVFDKAVLKNGEKFAERHIPRIAALRSRQRPSPSSVDALSAGGVAVGSARGRAGLRPRRCAFHRQWRRTGKR